MPAIKEKKLSYDFVGLRGLAYFLANEALNRTTKQTDLPMDGDQTEKLASMFLIALDDLMGNK